MDWGSECSRHLTIFITRLFECSTNPILYFLTLSARLNAFCFLAFNRLISAGTEHYQLLF